MLTLIQRDHSFPVCNGVLRDTNAGNSAKSRVSYCTRWLLVIEKGVFTMTFRKILAAAMISAAACGASDAMAAGRHGGWGGGYYGHHGYHGGYSHGYGRVGAFVGGAIVAGALLSPWYYSPYYVTSYPTVVEVVPAAPTVYFEQAQAAVPAASDAGSWWYFCNDTRAYYPYVKECASPWQRVAPSPAPAAPR